MIERLRLAAHVRARRHLSGDASVVVLHAEGHSGVLVLGEREWRVVQAMDGSRDLAGIAIAAARAGAPVRSDHVAEFVTRLDKLGLLGVADPAPASSALPRDVPLRSLPDYRFACDGTGDCCRSFGSILFTPREVAMARATLPDLESVGDEPSRLFLPERGLDEALFAVAERDGACAYFGDDGCALHAAGGPEAKPFGCRTFPTRFVDTGAEIRVTPRPECACVFEQRDGHVPPMSEATRGAELSPQTYVPRLPQVVDMGSTSLSTEDFVAWCDEQSVPEGDDVVLAFLGLADGGRAKSFDSLRPALEELLGQLERLSHVQAGYRGPEDHFFRCAETVREAIETALKHDPARSVQADRDERLYTRAMFFGCWLADAATVQGDLRQRAAHLFVARAVRAAAHPIAVVESLVRAHGLIA